MRRQNKFISAALSLAAALLFCPPAAVALDLDCLADARGEVITWRSKWQTDGHDEGTIYEIIDAKLNDERNPTEVTLLLAARGPSAEPNRAMTVKKQPLISELCGSVPRTVSRLVRHDPFSQQVYGGQPAKNEQISAGRSAGPAERSLNLPYIMYISAKGWVRGERPALGSFTTCPVGDKLFTCPAEDKSEYGDQLTDIAADMKLYEEFR